MAPESRSSGAEKPGAASGALVGAFLTAPLIALFFLAARFFGLAFVPFDVFDWTTRILPGGLITFGIDTMVKAIRAVGLTGTDTAAKAAEQTMAIGMALVVGMVAGALLFVLLRLSKRMDSRLAGLLLGAVAGIAALLIAHRLGRATPVIGALWIIAAFLCWGASLGWAHHQLTWGPRAPVTARGVAVAVERVNRRQFIVRLGGAAATLTVVGAAVGSVAA